MNSEELVDRHFEGLEPISFNLKLQGLHHDQLAYLVLLWKIGSIDRFETRQPMLNILGLLRRVRERQIAPAIVVSIITDKGGKLGCLAHLVVPLVG